MPAFLADPGILPLLCESSWQQGDALFLLALPAEL